MIQTKLLSPPVLSPGDIVDIVAPSSKCHPSVLEKIRVLLNSWELECRIPDDLFGESLLYANDDEKRFKHLANALINNDSKAVWCLLGGFGTTKIIPMLDEIKPPQYAKQFIGFSDITALHIFLQVKWGWSTIHGPSGYQVCLNKVSEESIELLKRLLFTATPLLSYNVKPLNQFAEENITLTAPIIGGNLHIIQTTIGTPWQMDAHNKILFLEEVGERAYKIDRILTQLTQVGIFNQVKAVLLGDFIDKGEPDGRFLVNEVLHDFATKSHVPVLKINNIGHGFINNPLILGLSTHLKMGSNGVLAFPTLL